MYGEKVNVPEYVVTATGRFRVVSDHLGSPHVVVDEATGAVVMRVDYDEFGNVTVSPPASAGMVPFGFAGGIWDPETGLVRFGARDYDAVAGRWTAKDPLEMTPERANPLAYANNDPVNHMDPTGQDWNGIIETMWNLLKHLLVGPVACNPPAKQCNTKEWCEDQTGFCLNAKGTDPNCCQESRAQCLACPNNTKPYAFASCSQ